MCGGKQENKQGNHEIMQRPWNEHVIPRIYDERPRKHARPKAGRDEAEDEAGNPRTSVSIQGRLGANMRYTRTRG